MAVSKDDLAAAETRRTETSDAIVGSTEPKRLIVAGPGTGKTHNFKRALKAAPGEGLALTFIRALANDLETDLGEIARVNTLHGYCKSLAHAMGGVGEISARFDYYPDLFRLLAADLSLLRGESVSDRTLDRCFHTMEDTGGLLTEALQLGEFYDAVSHTDAVYRVIGYFDEHPEAVPGHPLVVIDEYQDFSLLETRFVEALATKSPVLIAGDDDQALYGFKHASANFIRDLAEDSNYELFQLPYCSRCTEVIVDAVNSVVAFAQADGHLADRLDREYLCYLPDKLIDSEAHPSIIHAACSVEAKRTPYMGRYIAEQIAAIPEEDIAESREKGYPTVLVIGRRHFVTAVYDVIKEQFPDATLRLSEESSIDPLDGYRRLGHDATSSLGWRILLEHAGFTDYRKVLAAALAERTDLHEVIPSDYREHHLGIAGIVVKLLDGDEVSEQEEAALSAELRLQLEEIRERLGLVAKDVDDQADDEEESAVPSIVCTSLLGAKGLQAGHVFIVGFNDGSFPSKPAAITDDEICKLIVGLSRTRKECHLVSCGRYAGTPTRASSFLKWLGVPVETRSITKDHWA